MVLIHYGVKGMKWNQNLMAQEYIPVGRRPRAREKNVSEGTGTGKGIYRREAVNTNNKPVGIAGSRPTQVKVVGTSPSGKKQVVIQNEATKPEKTVKEYDTPEAKEARRKESIARVNGNSGTKSKDETEDKDEESKTDTKKSSSRSSRSGKTRRSSTRKKTKSKTKKEEKQEVDELDDIALKVIRGDYGNGEARKKALGDNYAQIQARVNELMKIKKLINTKGTKKRS